MKTPANRLAAMRRYRAKYPERVRATQARCYRKHPELWRKSSLKQKFGITLKQYCSLWIVQRGYCAICQQPETVKRGKTWRWLCVDHDHTTKRVRGLLCSRCNQALGLLDDDIIRLRKATNYLARVK